MLSRFCLPKGFPVSSYRTVSAPAYPFRPSLLSLLLVAVVLAGCGAKDAVPPQGGGAGGPPPATVGVVTVASEVVALQTELPGRVSSERVAAEKTRMDLTDLRFKYGASNAFDVLDDQRSFFAAQQVAVQVQAQQVQNMVTPYKVLGRGWK